MYNIVRFCRGRIAPDKIVSGSKKTVFYNIIIKARFGKGSVRDRVVYNAQFITGEFVY